MPFYEVTTKGEEVKRLIKAPSAKAAIQHCVKDKFETRTVTSVEDAADLFMAGVTIEVAGDEPAAKQEEK